MAVLVVPSLQIAPTRTFAKVGLGWARGLGRAVAEGALGTTGRVVAVRGGAAEGLAVAGGARDGLAVALGADVSLGRSVGKTARTGSEIGLSVAVAGTTAVEGVRHPRIKSNESNRGPGDRVIVSPCRPTGRSPVSPRSSTIPCLAPAAGVSRQIGLVPHRHEFHL